MCDEDAKPTYTIHPSGLRPYFASCDIGITERVIQDKSRDDILTKALVLLQTTWSYSDSLLA